MMMVIYKFSENMNKTILRTKKIPLLQRIGGSMKTLPITCLVKILAEIHCSIYVHSVIHSEKQTTMILLNSCYYFYFLQTSGI